MLRNRKINENSNTVCVNELNVLTSVMKALEKKYKEIKLGYSVGSILMLAYFKALFRFYTP